ncbi:hypothetical protein [Mesorhizobium huakuii]|uniref:Uncharacterized protein n=1 Tax=Mesorhizobium huakuii TaxID=28104 RepID=A0A7G6STP0_9HYPH|nr:hypothetical protein [Mesorhizobium huakuii]QND57872.1 hypothetical protein HB778_15640 [Mesorhizobium huakuii]
MDTAFAGLAQAVVAYLGAGGQAELAGRWLLSHVAAIDPRISRFADYGANAAVNDRGLRGISFENTLLDEDGEPLLDEDGKTLSEG